MKTLLAALLCLLTLASAHGQAAPSPSSYKPDDSWRVLRRKQDSLDAVSRKATAEAVRSHLQLLQDRENDQLSFQRQHDSMQVVIAKQRKAVEAYNRTHPIKKPAAKQAKR
ncbi:MAG: hypothetical protein ACRYFX_13955 [Janthinobacterium lividum]